MSNYREAVDNFVNQQHEKIEKEIFEKQVDGSLYIGLVQMDCDMCEFTSRAIIKATMESYKDFDNQVYMESEGSYSMTILTYDEYKDWMYRSIDHRAEQYNY
jgi:hypothetical protein